ncbi:MAG: hypothetical protein ACHQ7M_04445 [Chloroflexota bacterium]
MLSTTVLRSLVFALGLALSVQAPALAAGPVPAPVQAPEPAALTIGVDYPDPTNQQPDQHRVFEYTDFFPRDVTVHRGDVLDFRSAPASFHVIGLAPSDAVGRSVYPVGFPDQLDPTPAPGSGVKKLGLGPSNFSVTGGSVHGGGTVANNPLGPPVCGVLALHQPLCSFSGGDDVEIAGPVTGLDGSGKPAPADWQIAFNAPPGKYAFLCWIHPHMTGTVTVVPDNQPATSQATADAQAQAQFAAAQAQALQAEQAANKPAFSGGAPGTRTYQVSVGVSGGDHVRIDEMLPTQALSLTPGDKVQYQWLDTDNVHTVTFPAGNMAGLPEPFGFNCGTSYQSPPSPEGPPPATPFQPCLYPGAQHPDFIADPGNAPPGTALTDPGASVDSGVLFGTGYGVTPSSQSWSIVVNGSTKAGSYVYRCTVHDWMQGTLKIGI